MTKDEAEELREENRRLNDKIAELEGKLADSHPSQKSRSATGNGSVSNHELATRPETHVLYDMILKRLLTEPKIMRLQTSKPEIRIEETREVVEADSKTLRGRLAVLIHKGFFNDPATASAAHTELLRVGFSTAKPNVYKECDKLTEMGFLTKEAGGYQTVEGMKVNVIKK